jgi:formylglycine-generating enzyme required for sulfatase activity
MAKRVLVLLAVAVLVLIGCEQSAEHSPTSVEPAGAAKMRLNFSVPTNLNIDTGQVTVTKGDLEYSQTVDLHAGSGTVLFTGLQPGLWQIDVGLYDAEGALIYQGSGEAAVRVGQVASAHIVLTELTGDLEITVEMPGGEDEGPVAYYPFNGNATDESANDNNGTIVGGATPTTDRFGHQNRALGFDGVSGTVVVDQALALLSLGQPQYTICGWFNTADASKPYQTVFNTIPHRGIAIDFNHVDFADNTIVWHIGPGPGDPPWAFSGIGAKSDYRQGQWYFFTIVKQGITYRCYIDGAIDYEGVVPEANTYTEMVGCRMGSIGNIQFFNGKLDDYRIYDRALSGHEIQALYAEGGWSQPAGDLEGFVRIAPGTFTMGSPVDEPGRRDNETQHNVTLTHGIYVQTTEVTNQQYMEVAQWAYDNGHVTATSACLYDKLDGSTERLKALGSGYEMTFSAGVFSCVNPTHPAKWVTWCGAVAYCDWLSLRQGLPRAYNHATGQCNSGNPYTAAGYRLPTEAEWEYACRAGTQTPFNTGSCLDAGSEANYDGSRPYAGCPTGPYVGWTVPVGSYPANAFGLYDMHGNVWEFCNDWSGPYGGTVTDPVGPVSPVVGTYRVVRGGVWFIEAQICRSACRLNDVPNSTYNAVGFRPVRSVGV